MSPESGVRGPEGGRRGFLAILAAGIFFLIGPLQSQTSPVRDPGSQTPAPASALSGPAVTAPDSGPLTPDSGPRTPDSYTPHRVYDSRKNRFIDFEELASRLARADLVFVGEQHDDPATHRMELAILEGLARRRDSVVLSLEMFERDVQHLLDRYLSGSLGEDSLLAGARPWRNYRTDYRPLVELARVRGWPVLASNVPRPLAAMVSRGGLEALDTLAPERRAHAATEIRCPEDGYYDRFVAAMGDLSAHGANGSPGELADRVRRMYLAQCVKDETMAEAVAAAWKPGWLVIHYNGSFHSDFGLGTVERARRRLGKPKMVVITALPVADLDQVRPSKEERKRADYLLYVLAPARSAGGTP